MVFFLEVVLLLFIGDSVLLGYNRKISKYGECIWLRNHIDPDV